MTRPEIHADLIRQTLLDRAEAHAQASGCSLSAIGEAALRNGKFLNDVKNGANFTIRTFQRVMDWIDQSERDAAAGILAVSSNAVVDEYAAAGVCRRVPSQPIAAHGSAR